MGSLLTRRTLIGSTRSTRRRFLSTLTALSAATIRTADAQLPFPHRPVTLVVPYAAAGEADSTARRMAAALAGELRQPVVVENVPGASGGLAGRRVLRARADGYTLMFATTSDLVVAPAVNQQLRYQASDFSLIAMYGRAPMALVVRAGLGIQTIDAFIDEARRQPGQLSLGTTGRQSLQALAAQNLVRAATVHLLHVPYQSGQQLMLDLASGRIDSVVVPLPSALTQARQWGHTLIGTLSAMRNLATPQVPTVNEGRVLRGVSSEMWSGLAAPPGLTTDVATVLNQAVRTLLTNASLHAFRVELGDLPAPSMSAADFAEFVHADEVRLRAALRDTPLV